MSAEAVTPTSGGRERSNANLKPFTKGVSGNPSGKSKKVKEVEDEAKSQAAKAMKKLVSLIDSKDPKVAVIAAREVLDRALGKPKQTVATSVIKKTLDELSTEDLIAALQSPADSGGTSETEAGDGEPDSFH